MLYKGRWRNPLYGYLHRTSGIKIDINTNTLSTHIR
jgi:hypothetical protein